MEHNESQPTVIQDVTVNGIRWDVEADIILAVRKREHLVEPWLQRAEIAPEDTLGMLLTGLAERCNEADAPALLASLRTFMHYATEATNTDRDSASAARYERAADLELRRFASLPCRI